MTIAFALIVAPTVAQQPPLLVIWNASPSVPVGLYLVTKPSPRVGDLVVVRLPPVIAAFAARRGYLPASAYLIKPIAAVAGDLVCRLGDRVFVRGMLAGAAADTDAHGNTMPSWQGCRILQMGGFSSWPIIPQASTAATSVRSIPHQSRDAPFSSGLTGLRVDARLAVAVRGGGLPAPLTPAMSPNKINIRPR
jgi:type IV secretory pathway protease TraF